MGNIKKLSTLLLGIITAAVLFMCTGCPCPKSPDPVVSILEEGGFAVTPGQVQGADSVWLYSADANGVPLDTFKIAVGQAQEFHYEDDVPTPIHIKLSYTNSSGKIILDDFISVEAIGGNPGTPIIATDVVMGFTAPPPQQQPCTNTNEIATGQGEVIVSWVTNDWFEVHLTKANGSVERIGIRMEGSTVSGVPGTSKIYRSDSHSCMTNPAIDASNVKSMMVGTSTEPFYISATDMTDGYTPRTLKIRNPSGLTIKVRK